MVLIASSTLQLELGLGYLLILPFWIAAIGVLTGRVLGVRIGRWRITSAAIVGWLAGFVGSEIAVGPNNVDRGRVILLSVFFGVLAILRSHPGCGVY